MKYEQATDLMKSARKMVLQGQKSHRNFQASKTKKAESRIGVGISQVSPKNYILELRVERTDGAAAQIVEAMRKEAGEDIRVLLTENARITPPRDIDEHQCHPRLGGTGPVPLILGVSVSHHSGPSGSLGAFMEHRDGVMLASCSHVLFHNDSVKKRDRVLHPAADDVPVVTNQHEIGELALYSREKYSGQNTIDAALALVYEEIDYRGNIIPSGVGAPGEGASLKKPISPAEVDLFLRGRPLAKVGSTTGGTVGKFVARHGHIPLSSARGIFAYQDIVQIAWDGNSFAMPGDSGGIVYDPETMNAIGLHIGSGIDYEDGEPINVSYACLLYHVEQTWGVRLMT